MKLLLPFDPATGRLDEEIWRRWLALDPVRMAEPYADALRSMRRIYLDAGRQDEFFLDLGAQAFSDELTRLDIPHTLELFDGKQLGLADGASFGFANSIRGGGISGGAVKGVVRLVVGGQCVGHQVSILVAHHLKRKRAAPLNT